MQIIHGLEDLGFKAENLDDLKKQIEDFYTVYGYKPSVVVQDGKPGLRKSSPRSLSK